jgi:flagellar export protein FliJ
MLELKEKEKENAQLLMAKAIQSQETIEDRLNEISNKITVVEAQIDMKQNQKIPIKELQMSETYIGQLKKRLHLEQIQLSMAKKNVEKKQEVLRETLKEEQTWFLLKEKKELEYFEQQKIEEQNQLDEIASRLYFRQMGLKG